MKSLYIVQVRRSLSLAPSHSKTTNWRSFTRARSLYYFYSSFSRPRERAFALKTWMSQIIVCNDSLLRQFLCICALVSLVSNVQLFLGPCLIISKRFTRIYEFIAIKRIWSYDCALIKRKLVVWDVHGWIMRWTIIRNGLSAIMLVSS